MSLGRGWLMRTTECACTPGQECTACRQIRKATDRMLHHPHAHAAGMGFNQQESDPVAWANYRTSLADVRAALVLACGRSVDEIDPATGHYTPRRPT